MNPIGIYMLGNLIQFDQVSARLLGGPVAAFLNGQIAAGLGDVVISVGGMLLALLICREMHRRKIYLRL